MLSGRLTTRYRRVPAAVLVALFATTMLLSATLLFAIQPMFTKMVLPMLGGSPAVWNTAMLFFQTVLLAGYAYAHLTTKFLTWRHQVMLHAAVLAVAFISLPIAPMAGWRPPTETLPVFWLFGLFAASIGLPFFVVSSTAPLLQRWFAASGHPSASDPYFLYGASNLGSIAALLAYPTIIQPLIGLSQQSLAWMVSYAVLALLIVICAVSVRGSTRVSDFSLRQANTPASADTPVGWRLRLQWIAFAFVPSSMMLGVTSHISTDVAAAPLLWVLPLALYLLSFVFVFARRPALKHSWMIAAQPYLVILVALNLAGLGKVWLYALSLNLLTFFVCAMVSHGELVRRRPAASDLTEFYLFMSIGGMLGGAFNALLAPVLFDTVIEYPLALVLACMLRPAKKGSSGNNWRLDLILPGILLAVLALPPLLPGYQLPNFGKAGNIVFVLGLSLLIFSFKERPLRFGFGVGAFLIGISALTNTQQLIAHERSFFGVHRVQIRDDGQTHVLLHGTTIHGAQFTDPEMRRTQMTYYNEAGPFGQIFKAFGDRPQANSVGMVGLGTGTLACYRRPGQNWTFYEIDPVVVSIARDPRLFSYLADCAPEARIVVGDARLSLQAAAPHGYGILLLDAFSSDAIPLHLMTREALEGYLEKLTDDGVLIFHTSNRNLDLAPVLAGLAKSAGLAGRYQRHFPEQSDGNKLHHIPAEAVVMAREDRTLAALDETGPWVRLDTLDAAQPWTDDYSNLIGSIHFMRNR